MDRKEAIELIKRHMIIHQIGKYPHIKLGEALSLAIAVLQEPERNYCGDCGSDMMVGSLKGNDIEYAIIDEVPSMRGEEE